MQALNTVDQFFLLVEKPHQPTHVAGLQIFSIPSDAKESFVDQLYNQYLQANEAKGIFNKKLTTRWGRPFWQKDDSFDIGNHLFRHQLPSESNSEDLLQFVQELHEPLMDKTLPLWEVHVIEGLDGDKFAIYSKIHHALIDGVSGIHLMNQSLSDNPDEIIHTPIWCQESIQASKKKKPSLLRKGLELTKNSRKQLQSIPGVFQHLKTQWNGEGEFDSLFPAPKSHFNQRISSSRRFITQSINAKRVKNLAEELQCSSNDIILAVCASALRHYLLLQDKLPEKPLVASVPASLRRDESIGGNEVAMLTVNLATHLEAPKERVETIIESARNEKDRLKQMSKEEIINSSFLRSSPLLATWLTGISMPKQPFNLIISHVVGTKQKLFLNGAELESITPVSTIQDGNGFNISLVSYGGEIHFGFLACEKMMKDLAIFPQTMDSALAELERMTGLNQSEEIAESLSKEELAIATS